MQNHEIHSKDLRQKTTFELIEALEQASYTAVTDGKILSGPTITPIIENDIEQVIVERISSLSADELLKYQFVKLKRIYNSGYFDSDKKRGEETKKLRTNVLTGYNTEKTSVVNIIILNINKELHESLINTKHDDTYIDLIHYNAYCYWDPNDTQFIHNESAFLYEGDSQNPIKNKKEYQNAIKRHAFIQKRVFKTKLHYAIAEIIKSYEQNNKSVFNDFDEIYNFIKDSLKISEKYNDEMDSTKVYQHAECNIHIKNKYISPVDKVSKKLTEINIQPYLFSGTEILVNLSSKKIGLPICLQFRQSEGSYVEVSDLCAFDVSVSTAISSLFWKGPNSITDVSKPNFFTINDIARRLTGNDQAQKNNELKQQIHDSLIRLQNVESFVTYEQLNKARAFKDQNINILKSYARYKRLLNMGKAFKKEKNGQIIEGYIIDDIPLLSAFGYALGHLRTYDTKVLSVIKKPTAQDIAMRDYLLREISTDKHNKSTFESILEAARIEYILQNKDKKKIFKAKLNNWFIKWKDRGIVTNFKIDNESVTWSTPKDVLNKLNHPIY